MAACHVQTAATAGLCCQTLRHTTARAAHGISVVSGTRGAVQAYPPLSNAFACAEWTALLAHTFKRLQAARDKRSARERPLSLPLAHQPTASSPQTRLVHLSHASGQSPPSPQGPAAPSALPPPRSQAGTCAPALDMHTQTDTHTHKQTHNTTKHIERAHIIDKRRIAL